MSLRGLSWLCVLAAYALPHLPLPPLGADFEDGEAARRQGRRALIAWASEGLGLAGSGVIALSAGFRTAGATLVAAATALALLGTWKLRLAAVLARGAGYRP